MNRKMAREKAMNLFYQMDIQNDFTIHMIKNFLEEIPEDNKQISYIKNTALSFLDHKDIIDHLIEENSKEWKLNRIAKVDLAILRLAITEIMYFEDIPKSVSINEAVEMAKIYSTDESSSFVNGLLGNIIEKK